MKKIIIILIIVCSSLLLFGCERYETDWEKCEKMGGWYRSGGYWGLPSDCIFKK